MNKYTISAAFSIAVMGVTSAFAAGMDRTRLPIAMMFEEENYGSVAFSSTSPDVKDNRYAKTKSMYSDYSSVTGTFKTQINEKLSVGLANYQSAGIDLSYINSGSAFLGITPTSFETYPYVGLCALPRAVACTAAETGLLTAFGNISDPYVSLKVNSTALLLGYKAKDDITVLAGVKRSVGSATADIIADPYGDVTADDASGIAMVVGASYEKPEIALRATLTYQAKTEMSHVTRTVLPNGTAATLQNTKSALPASLTLDFQTGIAENTLLYGSVHHAKWSDAHIYFDGSTTPKSTWKTSNSYSLGIGRKLSDAWAISASVNYEGANTPAGSSLLSTTDGVTGLTLGGKFSRDNMTVTAGVNQSKLGEKTVTSIAGAGKFTGGSVTTIGMKVGFNF
jgi:long-chain fatty acid transport protein